MNYQSIKLPNRKWLLAGVFILFIFAGRSFAQDKMNVAPEDFSGGISLQISGAELQNTGDFLALSDSLGHKLALLEVTLDGEKRWAKASQEAPELPGVVHWYFDDAAGRLVVDLRALKSAITGESELSLAITVLNTRSKHFKISAYDAEKRADDQLSVLSKIKDVDVDVQ